MGKLLYHSNVAVPAKTDAELLQFTIDEGFVSRDPTPGEKLSLPHPAGTEVTKVFERPDMTLYLVVDEKELIA